MKIIALTGAKGSGKDTVGDIMQALSISCDYASWRVPVKRIAFADPIKRQIEHIFNLSTSNYDQYDLFKRSVLNYDIAEQETRSVEARHVVREIGMLMRSYDEKQFVNYVRAAINNDPDAIWVITDLRFDNEYMMLREMGAIITKIVRPQVDSDGHITERGFGDHMVDKIIMNDGNMEYLETRVEWTMNSISKEWA